MEDNQINGQKISKEAYCPNSFFDNGTISIGEFKTLDDAMNFPIKKMLLILQESIEVTNKIGVICQIIMHMFHENTDLIKWEIFGKKKHENIQKNSVI